MRDALSTLLLGGGGCRCVVLDGAGRVKRAVRRWIWSAALLRDGDGGVEQAADRAAGGPVIPNFGGSRSFACERANRSFCFDWVSRNWGGVLWPALRQHILLTVAAVAIGFVISTALALVAHRHRALERPIVAVTLVLYTIPSLALFELLVAVRGLGLSVRSAEVALVSYTLLILFRNTLTGLRAVPEPRCSTRRAGWA